MSRQFFNLPPRISRQVFNDEAKKRQDLYRSSVARTDDDDKAPYLNNSTTAVLDFASNEQKLL